MPKIKKVCENCGNEILVWKYRKDNQRFCNMKCKSEFGRKKVKCDECGKEIDRVKSKKSILSFCSLECKNTSILFKENISRILKNSEVFQEARKNADITYVKGVHKSPETEYKCGEENPNWKGGTEKYYGSDWKSQKQLALDRDKCCRRCGTTEDLAVHHIIRYKESKDNDLKNLITFCRRCHIVVEKQYGGEIDDDGNIIVKHMPPQFIETFLRFSEDEFEGNTGFCLKFLLDFYFGRLVDGSRIAEAKADEALSQVQELKSNGQTEKKTIRMVNGKELRI